MVFSINHIIHTAAPGLLILFISVFYVFTSTNVLNVPSIWLMNFAINLKILWHCEKVKYKEMY